MPILARGHAADLDRGGRQQSCSAGRGRRCRRISAPAPPAFPGRKGCRCHRLRGSADGFRGGRSCRRGDLPQKALAVPPCSEARRGVPAAAAVRCRQISELQSGREPPGPQSCVRGRGAEIGGGERQRNWQGVCPGLRGQPRRRSVRRRLEQQRTPIIRADPVGRGARRVAPPERPGRSLRPPHFRPALRRGHNRSGSFRGQAARRRTG